MLSHVHTHAHLCSRNLKLAGRSKMNKTDTVVYLHGSCLWGRMDVIVVGKCLVFIFCYISHLIKYICLGYKEKNYEFEMDL